MLVIPKWQYWVSNTDYCMVYMANSYYLVKGWKCKLKKKSSKNVNTWIELAFHLLVWVKELH